MTTLSEALLNSDNQKGISVSGADGEHPFITSDTVFDDRPIPLIGKRIGTSTGTADYDWDELGVVFSANGGISDNNDVIATETQMPHGAKLNGKIYPHIHWWQTSSSAYVFTLQYRVQDNGSAKTTSWTNMTATAGTDDVYTYTSGTLNQITRFKDGSGNYYIDLDGVGISATIQFRMTRTDALAGTATVTFFDFHYEIDTLGSRDEIVK